MNWVDRDQEPAVVGVEGLEKEAHLPERKLAGVCLCSSERKAAWALTKGQPIWEDWVSLSAVVALAEEVGAELEMLVSEVAAGVGAAAEVEAGAVTVAVVAVEAVVEAEAEVEAGLEEAVGVDHQDTL